MENQGALAGIKVLDLGRVIAAPYCTAILGDMGADVIKVETPGIGDDSRNYVPKYGYYALFNRSKRGMTLNLKSEKGREAFLKLVAQSDVVVENFRPGVMKKLGLDYESLKQVKPDLVYAAISGFGQEGPYSQLAGYDPLIQAMTGLSAITGHPGGEPVRCGASVCDMMAGLNAALGVVTALYYRSQTGIGQMIDVALCDMGIMAAASVNQNYLCDGVIPVPLGNGYAAGAPGNLYKAKDGYFMYAGANNGPWKILCEEWGHPELVDDPRFCNRAARAKNRDEVDRMFTEWASERTVEECIAFLRSKKLACGPLYNIEQVYNDPHMGVDGVRRIFEETEFPKGNKMTVTGQNFLMSETQPRIRRNPPELGENNAEILAELGYSADEIGAMYADGAI